MSQTSANSSPCQSQPGTPTGSTSDDHAAQLKELLLMLTPSKSGQEMSDLRAQLAAGLDDQARVQQQCKRRLVDTENEANNPHKRACRSRNHRTEDEVVDSSCNPKRLEERVRRYGRKFVMLCGPWLALGNGDLEAFFKTTLDDDYDAELRFAADDPEHDEHEERQGQLRELRDILPNDLLPFLTSSWMAKAFDDGMHSQCSSTVTRLRHAALSHIVAGFKVNNKKVKASKLSSSEVRQHLFAVPIGWSEDKGKYAYWDILFLHGNESETLDFNEVFRHALLLKIFVSSIRGPTSADGVMEKRSQHPKAITMQRIFNIKHTTPGAIAGSAVWTIWLFSADTMFGRIGDVTGINYYHRYNEYLAKILEGLRRRQQWARELFLFWDSHVFPETNGSNFGGGVQEDAEDVRAELAAATDVLTNMPVMSDDN
ncbi:hypothetical protein MVEN_01614200 [Mycena venus]|uniref:Uncharacterized protein n=1 Tax=Mycena venus TaxID=2733690 RepID=A0A8H6XT15_9AGAR|nr:hypothetical protein MVEN_01614200 [Mycena venus]